jgi:hypothetical protein
MGIHIYLHIQPNRIDPAAWASVYDEALALLKAHPAGLIGVRFEKTATGTRRFYSRNLEVDRDDPRRRYFTVCGDRASRETGEGHDLYRDLKHYQEGRAFSQSRFATAKSDILLGYNQGDWRAARVFGNKTQGRPYHLPLLAVAALIENHFPTAAVVTGDIDAAQAERGRWLGEVGARP